MTNDPIINARIKFTKDKMPSVGDYVLCIKNYHGFEKNKRYQISYVGTHDKRHHCLIRITDENGKEHCQSLTSLNNNFQGL